MLQWGRKPTALPAACHQQAILLARVLWRSPVASPCSDPPPLRGCCSVEEHEDLRKVRAHSNGRTAPLPSALLIHQPTDPQPPTRPTRARPTREGALDPEAPACRLIRPDAECRKVGGVSDRHAPGGHVRSQRDRRDLREVALAEADRHELRRRLKRLGMFDRVTFVGRKNFVTAGAVSETPRAAPWSATSWRRKSASNTRGRLQLFLRARGSPCRDPGLQPLTS